ncbi:MAG TPA: hypothetical protein VHM48_03960 [Candidatus Limnocylindrales bacterium]|nr:hypothetical protein [Candidatus Limnocylindrales bacterium]
MNATVKDDVDPRSANGDRSPSERPSPRTLAAREAAIGAGEKTEELTVSGLVPRLRIRPGRLGADPAGIAARADTLEVGDAIEDRPVEIGQVFGKRGD